MVIVQLTMIGIVGWMLTIATSALGNKEIAGLMRAATVFALVALGAEWAYTAIFVTETKTSIFHMIWNLLS